MCGYKKIHLIIKYIFSVEENLRLHDWFLIVIISGSGQLKENIPSDYEIDFIRFDVYFPNSIHTRIQIICDVDKSNL